MNSFIVGIAGGSGSGKSTFTNRLKDYYGDRITVLYHDNYYRSQDSKSMEERRKVNYDHPDALETDLLISHLKALKQGKTVECPIYDFTVHNRIHETLLITPCPVILVEGILLFNDPELLDLLDLKIYIEADADERILRRARRDMAQRGRKFDDIMNQYLTTVKPMHYRYVEPTKHCADLILNSGKNEMAFALVRDYLEKKLKDQE